MCSGRVDPQFVMEAFAKGADGVLLGGCHPGDCHYAEGNYKTLRRMRMLDRMFKDMGIADGRFRLEWISGAEGDKVKSVVNDMVAKVRALGPLDMPGKFKEWDKELEELEARVNSDAPKEAVHAR